MITSLNMGNIVPSPSWSVFSTSFKETINCFSGQILTKKRGHFPGAGLDFIMPTEALHSFRRVDGSPVHLRLRENLRSLIFLCLILLLKHKLGHLAIFAHTAAASIFSCTHYSTPWVLALPFLQWGELAAESSRQAEKRRKRNSCQTLQECWIVYLCLCLPTAHMSIYGEELTNQSLLRCFELTLKFQEKPHLDKQCKMMHQATHMGGPGKLFRMECCEWQ